MALPPFDPISALSGGVGLIGAGIGAYGAFKMSQDAAAKAGVEQDITRTQMSENLVKQNFSAVLARRNSLQILRNAQRAGALARSAAVSQGANFGSGYAGGQSQESAEAGYGLQGIQQRMGESNTLFGMQNTISMDQFKLAGIESSMATDQGIMGLGQGIAGGSQPAGRVLSSLFPRT